MMRAQQERNRFRPVLLLFISFIIAGCEGDPKIELDISDQTVTDNKMLEISGRITDAKAGALAVLEQSPAIQSAPADDGTFLLPPYLLQAGDNPLTVQAVLDGNVVALASLSIVYESGESASDHYTSDGTVPTTVSITDSSDPAYGASITIPSGSLDIDADVSIASDPEHFPKLPLGITAVGNPITFQPIGQSFSEPIQLSVPYDPDAVAPDSADRLVVYGLSDNGWERLVPETVNTSALELTLSDLFYGGFVAALDNDYPVGTLVLRTQPSGATVYLDGVRQADLSPVVLGSLDRGDHELKLYTPGYNEKFVSFSVAEQALWLEETLTRVDSSAAPEVMIDSNIPDEQTVNDNVFSISGSVSVTSGNVSGTRLVLSLNDTDFYVSLAADGTYSHTVSLQAGSNTLSLRATDGAGNTGGSRIISIVNVEGASAAMLSMQGASMCYLGLRQAAAQAVAFL